MGKTLAEILGWIGPTDTVLTERQVVVWDAWFTLEINTPSRADWYAMQNGAELRAERTKKTVSVDDMRLVFGRPPTRQYHTPAEKAAAAARSKARYLAATGREPTPPRPVD